MQGPEKQKNVKIMKRIASLISILIISVFSGLFVGQALDISPFIPGVVSFVGSFIPLPGGCMYGLIFTAAGGIGAPFNYNGPALGELLYWNDAGNPLTDLRISSKEEGSLHDWNAASIAAMNGYLNHGVQAANQVVMKVASGHLERQVTIHGTTSAVGAINFYSSSDNNGQGMNPVPLKSQTDTNIALTQTIYQNFMALFIPTMATGTDYADVEFSDGHKDRWEMEDLLARSSVYQQVPGIIINNATSYIHRVTLRTAADTPVYKLTVYIKGQ